MPSEVDLLSFAELVERFGELVDGGYDGGGANAPWVNLGQRGIDMTGATSGHKAAIEAVVLDVLDDQKYNVGREIVGAGTVLVDENINTYHAAINAPGLLFQAVAGFTGPMITIGRINAPSTTSTPAYPGHPDNASLAVPSRKTMYAFGGTRSTGMQPNITGFHLNDEISPGTETNLIASYCGVGAYVDGNWEKQRVHIGAAYCQIALKVGSADPFSSSDSCVWYITTTNCNAIVHEVYEANAEYSGYFDIVAEAVTGSNPPIPTIKVSTGKFTRYRGIMRGSPGQGGDDGMVLDKDQNDGIDSNLNDLTWTTSEGRAISALRGKNLAGRPMLRAGTDGIAWNPATNSRTGGAIVPAVTVAIGQWRSGGGFTPIIVGNHATAGIQFGVNGYWSRYASFGRITVSKDRSTTEAPNGNNIAKAGLFPFTETAAIIHQAEKCYIPFAEMQGMLQVDELAQECSIAIPAPHFQTGYDASLSDNANVAIMVEGAVTLGEALAGPFAKRVAGENHVRFESISDLDGQAVTLKRGLATLEGQHRVSTLALQASASPINRYFRRAGLIVAPETGARAEELFVCKANGDWRSVEGGAAITPAQMAATTALIARMSTTPSAAWVRIYDELLFNLSDMGILANAVMAHLLGGPDQATARLSLFPATSGANYDATAYGTVAFTAKQGFANQPAIITIASAPAAGATLTLNALWVITFADAATDINAGALTATVDRRNSTTQIASDISSIVINRNGNTANYLAVSAVWGANNTLRLGGSLTALATTAGAAITWNPWTRLGAGYDMSAVPEGLSDSDMLMIALANRDTGDTGSDNGYDIDPGNGFCGIRLRDNSQAGGAGTTRKTSFPAGSASMPGAKMFGSLGDRQFGLDQGRVVVQDSRSGGTAAIGTPDRISYGGSRELFFVMMLKASDLFQTVGGVVKPKDGRALRLHRAVTGAYRAVRAL